MSEHECVFVEEEEPSGRLVLPPCIVCGCTGMDALLQLNDANPEAYRAVYTGQSVVGAILSAYRAKKGGAGIVKVLWRT